MEKLAPNVPDSLPIYELLPTLSATLNNHSTVLLTAPPGAGKTTRVPTSLLAADWLEGRRILMLEPRRLAARSAAYFMAGQLGESVGETIGFRTRLETKTSVNTRIEVVTEGILVRMLQNDPSLDNIACVIFDEFHERSLHSDLGLALVRDAQQALRPDLKLIVMSATLAVEPLKSVLDNPPLLKASGRTYPVEIIYRPARRDKALTQHAAATVRQALSQHQGSILVFLPGMSEIRQVQSALNDGLPADTHLYPLHGSLPPGEQDAAISPAQAGQRKVVLATAIAETSLTIAGIRVVVDAGLARGAGFDPNSGMSRLVTRPVSRAAAEQRAGRAGRIEPGICYRLWSQSQHASLQAAITPEILQADLSPVVLELANWGVRSPIELIWLDPPPEAHWRQAQGLLVRLQALTSDGQITAHGRAMLKPGLHPRLAHLLLEGRTRGHGQLAAQLAALLSDRDPLPRGSGSDISARLAALRGSGRGAGLGVARRLARRLDAEPPHSRRHDDTAIGELLALGFPDRIAKARDSRGRFLLSNGRGAVMPEDDPLAGQSWLVAPELDGQAREARIHLCASLSRQALEAALGDQIEQTTVSEWDDQRGTVIARRQRRLGALVVDEQELAQPAADVLEAGLLAAVRKRGLSSLPWTDRCRRWQARVEFLRSLDASAWPAVDDQSLSERLEVWLGPFLAGARSWNDIKHLDLQAALEHMLDRSRQTRLDELAPETLKVPTGRQVVVDYSVEGGPALATKLQSIFSWKETPRVAAGQVPVVLHLLSPAGRPLAITSDLASFWQQGYQEV
ncbi:MAG TPA: ATP-dependent helicase HrpB, partial [Wenzhouxiangella sp.]|nr:ATP-dependent helicase HrpB [Wenzhouxiangella sp.]